MTSLIPQSTRLIGRNDELTTLKGILTGQDTRLLTITGPGGVGKTRLALALANDIAGEFSDEVVFVSFATVIDGSLVVSTLARSLDWANRRTSRWRH